MEITLKIKFGTICTEGVTREQIIKGLCEQFQSGGEVWFTVGDMEYAAIVQDAQPEDE